MALVRKNDLLAKSVELLKQAERRASGRNYEAAEASIKIAHEYARIGNALSDTGSIWIDGTL